MNKLMPFVIGAVLLAVAFPRPSLGADEDARHFFEAIAKQDLVAVRAALEARPDLAAAQDAKGRSAVIAAAVSRPGEDFIAPAKNQILQAILAKRPALSFHDACLVGDADLVSAQLAKDASLAQSWNPFGFSALHCAAFSGQVETARVLLTHGANLEARAKTRFKNTPLQVALLVGHYDMTKFLLQNGADVLVRQSKGYAPIHEAAVLGRRDLVDLLLESGVEIDARTNDGRTALTEAMRLKHVELVEYLRSKGANEGEIRADLMAPAEE